jgi:hypothetical protein
LLSNYSFETDWFFNFFDRLTTYSGKMLNERAFCESTIVMKKVCSVCMYVHKRSKMISKTFFYKTSRWQNHITHMVYWHCTNGGLSYRYIDHTLSLDMGRSAGWASWPITIVSNFIITMIFNDIRISKMYFHIKWRANVNNDMALTDSGLPDGFFSNQKSKFGQILEHLRW